MSKWRVIEVKFTDMYHFQMYEAKIQDLEQLKYRNEEKYIYANISNFETEKYEDSEVRVYAHSFEDLYCAEDYELSFNNDNLEYFKKSILESYPYKKRNNKLAL